MPLLTVVLTLIVVGVLLYLLEHYVPMDATLKRIIHVVVIICVVIWLLQVVGLWAYLGNVKTPSLR